MEIQDAIFQISVISNRQTFSFYLKHDTKNFSSEYNPILRPANGNDKEPESEPKSWLPDFGTPALKSRDRSDYHEPAASHHYSDHEDEEQHRRRDSFGHHNPNHFSSKSFINEKTKKKGKRKKKSQPKSDATPTDTNGVPLRQLKKSISGYG